MRERMWIVAASVAAVEADHDRRGHCVDLGIWYSGRTQPRNTLAHSAGPITHCAGVDPTADGQQLTEQISHFSERRERGELGGHISEFGCHAALERKSRKTSRLFGEYLAARTILKPATAERHVAEQGSKGHLSISLAG
jgi:hypothetical protein